jgi:hypothetical protein
MTTIRSRFMSLLRPHPALSRQAPVVVSPFRPRGCGFNNAALARGRRSPLQRKRRRRIPMEHALRSMCLDIQKRRDEADQDVLPSTRSRSKIVPEVRSLGTNEAVHRGVHRLLVTVRRSFPGEPRCPPTKNLRPQFKRPRADAGSAHPCDQKRQNEPPTPSSLDCPSSWHHVSSPDGKQQGTRPVLG